MSGSVRQDGATSGAAAKGLPARPTTTRGRPDIPQDNSQTQKSALLAVTVHCKGHQSTARRDGPENSTSRSLWAWGLGHAPPTQHEDVFIHLEAPQILWRIRFTDTIGDGDITGRG